MPLCSLFIGSVTLMARGADRREGRRESGRDEYEEEAEGGGGGAIDEEGPAPSPLLDDVGLET